MQGLTVGPGRPWPMGATPERGSGDGGASSVNFAVFSAHATAVDVCIFDAAGRRELARLRLPERTGDVFHGVVAGLEAGAVYGLRADGPWAPADGHWFNPYKLLLDPYAREVVGSFEWGDEHRAGRRDMPDAIDRRDNAAGALKARVVAGEQALRAPPQPSQQTPPCTPLADSVIYELHVKGFSKLNPAVPEALRGSYAGLGHPASVAHLRRLGVTAVCLLPVHHHLDEERLVAKGLVNYWGYNTIGFFSPDPCLASAGDGAAVRAEFRAMVDCLHAAGIEVIIDVVYNHTAESDESGPSISFRGLDNASYYRLEAGGRRRPENHTGCGNTVDIRQPAVLRLVLDSLRHWVSEMHVDGFRFDLATVLGRADHGFDPRGAFFTALAQDPVLQRAKLIAEPWDIGPGGYQVGQFPRGWSEWNDKFRDDMRGYWLRASLDRGALAHRLCASADLFKAGRREPSASINYVGSHDGFTLRDLVSYQHKRNHANSEANRDGTDYNLSFNCGVDGPTDDARVNALRGRLQRVLLAVTLLAQGTPMIRGGDEFGQTQGGNNNPYCQDNATTWLDWSHADDDLTEFTARLVALRRRLLPFADRWYEADAAAAHGGVRWTGSDGETLHDGAWNDRGHRTLGCLIDAPGRAETPLLLLLNGGDAEVSFRLPRGRWTALLDSFDPHGDSAWVDTGDGCFGLRGHSLALLAAVPADAADARS